MYANDSTILLTYRQSAATITTSMKPRSDWLTTREVRQILGLSQQRVSQLVRAGALIADPDPDGRLKYDRQSVEALAASRAARASDRDQAEIRAVYQREARENFAKVRRAARAAAAARLAEHDDLLRRGVAALERMAAK